MLRNVKLGRGQVLGPVKKKPPLVGGYLAGRMPQDEFLDGSSFLQTRIITAPKRAPGIVQAVDCVEPDLDGYSVYLSNLVTAPKRALSLLQVVSEVEEPEGGSAIIATRPITFPKPPPMRVLRGIEAVDFDLSGSAILLGRFIKGAGITWGDLVAQLLLDATQAHLLGEQVEAGGLMDAVQADGLKEALRAMLLLDSVED